MLSIPQDHQPRGGTDHCGMGPPTSIIAQKNVQQICLQVIYSFGIPSSQMILLVFVVENAGLDLFLKFNHLVFLSVNWRIKIFMFRVITESNKLFSTLLIFFLVDFICSFDLFNYEPLSLLFYWNCLCKSQSPITSKQYSKWCLSHSICLKSFPICCVQVLIIVLLFPFNLCSRLSVSIAKPLRFYLRLNFGILQGSIFISLLHTFTFNVIQFCDFTRLYMPVILQFYTS